MTFVKFIPFLQIRTALSFLYGWHQGSQLTNGALVFKEAMQMLLNVAGASTLLGAVMEKSTIAASGNITSSDQVKGATVVSSGRMTTDKYL